MRKIVCYLFVLFSLFSTLAFAKDVERTPFHFNIGYSINNYTVGDVLEEDADSSISTSLAHGAQVAFDWQGAGHFGVQIPFEYYYHPEFNTQEFNVGANALIHFTKRNHALDPYALLGLKWVAGSAKVDNSDDRNWGIFPYPLLATGLGVRYFFTPNIGIYGEAEANNLIFLVWQFEGRLGLSVGF